MATLLARPLASPLQNQAAEHHVTRAGESGHVTSTSFACDECGRRFGKRSNLTRHRAGAHPASAAPSAERRFECAVCGTRFTRDDNRQRHQRQHFATPAASDAKRRHQCQHCLKRFATARVLGRHLSFNSPPAHLPTSSASTFDCSVCLRSFPLRCSLRRHLRLQKKRKTHHRRSDPLPTEDPEQNRTEKALSDTQIIGSFECSALCYEGDDSHVAK